MFLSSDILGWRYFKLTDLTDFFVLSFYSPIIFQQARDVFYGFTELCRGLWTAQMYLL